MARIINIIHQPHLTTYRAYDDSKHRCCTVCEYKIFIEKDNGEIVIASELEDCSLMGFNAEGFIKELSKEEKDADLYTPFTSAVGKEELEEFLNGEVEEKGGEVLHSVHNVLRALRESHCVIAHDALDSLQELKAELDKTIEETKKQ